MYDIAIIGAGPAGLTAAMYAIRQKVELLVLEAGIPGGQINLASKVCNYPGFPEFISGQELGKRMKEHAEALGVKITRGEVIELEKKGDEFLITTPEKEYTSKTVLVATGASHRQLGIPGEVELIGKGVSYCAACDANFFQGKIAAVIGAGNAAVDTALLLEKVAKKVYLIHRRDVFRAEQYLVDRLKKSKIELQLFKVCKEIAGKDKVKEIVLENIKTKEQTRLKVDGVFINIGITPVTFIAEKAGAKLDDRGYIVVNRKQETNVPGIFAAGDVTGNFNQVVVAAGEGANAMSSAFRYIDKKFTRCK